MRDRLVFATLCLSLIILILISAGSGAVHIHPLDLLSWLWNPPTGINANPNDAMSYEILMALRLPRILAAVLVGASLAVAGAGIQGIFRNPLADPGLIGISSGASLSSAIYIVLGASLGTLGYFGLSLFTFLGAAITAFLVYGLSRTTNGISMSTMLLAGIAISAIAGAGTGLLTYVSKDNELRDLTFWLLGSLGGASWEKLIVLAALTVPSMTVLLYLAGSLNAYGLGEEEAAYLGLRVGRVKLAVILMTTLLVGASVAISGIIGFIGLVVPHMVRIMFGSDHRFVLPASMVTGAAVLVVSDLVCRTVIAPAELPLGIITAAIGAPVFLSMLLKEKQRLSLLWT